jgi:hypothetical protein
MDGLAVGISRGKIVLLDSTNVVIGRFEPHAFGCIQLEAVFAKYGVTHVARSESMDAPEQNGCPAGFDAHRFVDVALRVPNKPGLDAPDSPERELEIAHLAVVDTVLEHLSECPRAVRDAVAEWRKASEAVARSVR